MACPRCWQLTAVPQAVTWLKDWVRDAKRDIAALEAEYYPQAPQLQERVDTLKNTYLKQVHRKEFLGEIPKQRVTTPTVLVTTRLSTADGKKQ